MTYNTESSIKEMQCPYDLVISLDAYQKIMGYTRIADGEITGFADVSLDETNKRFLVGEVYLLEQEAGAAHVTMDEEVVSNFNLQMIKKGITQLPRLWWHSHVNMGTFFSGTDVETYKETLKNDAWCIALVVNKQRQMKAVLQQYVPFPLTFDMDVFVDWDSAPVAKSLEAEVKKKVKEKKYTYTEPKKGITLFQGKGKWKKKNGILTQQDIEEEDDVLFVDGNRYSRILFLPKDPSQAEAKVKDLGLLKKWSVKRQSYVYCDEIMGDIWEDYWNSLQSFPFQGELKN